MKNQLEKYVMRAGKHRVKLIYKHNMIVEIAARETVSLSIEIPLVEN